VRSVAASCAASASSSTAVRVLPVCVLDSVAVASADFASTAGSTSRMEATTAEGSRWIVWSARPRAVSSTPVTVATCAVLASLPRDIPTYSAAGPVRAVITLCVVSTVTPWAACTVDA